MDLYDDIIDEVNAGADSKSTTDITTSSWANIPEKKINKANTFLPISQRKSTISTKKFPTSIKKKMLQPMIPRKRSRQSSNNLPFTPSKAVLSTTKKQKLHTTTTTNTLNHSLQSTLSK